MISFATLFKSLSSANISTLPWPSSPFKIYVNSSLLYVLVWEDVSDQAPYLGSSSHSPFSPGTSFYHLLLKSFLFFSSFPHVDTLTGTMYPLAPSLLKEEELLKRAFCILHLISLHHEPGSLAPPPLKPLLQKNHSLTDCQLCALSTHKLIRLCDI